MSDDIHGSISPAIVGQVGRDLPRRDQAPRQRRQPPTRQAAATPDVDDGTSDLDPPMVGTRLNVRA